MSDSEHWYILPISDAATRAQFLQSVLHIPCHDVQLSHGDSNIAFPASDVTKVMEQVGLGSAPYTVEPIGRDNMYLMKVKSTTSTGITDGDIKSKFKRGSNFEAWEYLLPVFIKVYNTYGVTIIPDNPHGDVQKPIESSDPTKLYVHFYSTAVETGKTKITKVYGRTLSGGQVDGLIPACQACHGVGIADRDGVLVAEIVDDNLYILFDLPHVGGDHVTEIFSEVMKKYFAIKGKVSSDIDRVLEPVKKSMGMSSRDKFVRDCNMLIDINIKELESELIRCNREMENYQQEFIRRTREREIIETKLHPLQATHGEKETWAIKEYDALCKTPHVQDIELEGNIIRVYTDMIIIPYRGKNYKIGKFRIDIFIDGSNGAVKAYNLTDGKDRVFHPHIKKDGYCCLGNISEGVTKLLAEYQYAVLIQLMINYLQTYNPGSTYYDIDNWSCY
jgi:hypothetical protein